MLEFAEDNLEITIPTRGAGVNERNPGFAVRNGRDLPEPPPPSATTLP